MQFISPIKVRVEQNGCVFEGFLQRTKNKVWENRVEMNSSSILIEKNAKVTVLTKVDAPAESKPYVGLYADETHDEWKELQDLHYYDEHLGMNRE